MCGLSDTRQSLLVCNAPLLRQLIRQGLRRFGEGTTLRITRLSRSRAGPRSPVKHLAKVVQIKMFVEHLPWGRLLIKTVGSLFCGKAPREPKYFFSIT